MLIVLKHLNQTKITNFQKGAMILSNRKSQAVLVYTQFPPTLHPCVTSLLDCLILQMLFYQKLQIAVPTLEDQEEKEQRAF